MIRVIPHIFINWFSLLSSFQHKCENLIHSIFFFLSETYADFKSKNSLSLVRSFSVIFYFFLTNCKASRFIALFSNFLMKIQCAVSKIYVDVVLMLIISRIIPMQVHNKWRCVR